RLTGSCRFRRRRPEGRRPVLVARAWSASTKAKNFAGGDRRHGARLLEQQPSSVIEPLKASGQFAFREPHLQGLAKTSRPLQPVGANRSKALAAVPLFQTLLHCRRQGNKQRLAGNQRTGRSEVDRGIGRVWRVRGTINANPDRNGKGRLAFTLDQNAGRLRMPNE